MITCCLRCTASSRWYGASCGCTVEALLVVALFRLDAQRGVRDDFQPLFRNQFARFAAYPVCFVLDAYQGGFEVLDEFELPLGETARFLFRQGGGPFLQYLERGRRIFRIVAHRVCDGRTQQLVIGLRLFELVVYDG